MRHLVPAALLALIATAALAQPPAGGAEDVAMTTLLRVCLDHAAGEPVETLVRRAQSGGFVRDVNRGGVLGEGLTWKGAGASRVTLSMMRGDGTSPAFCRIDVSHGDIDAKRLAEGVAGWAAQTSPAFQPAQAQRDMFDTTFGPEPVSRQVFRRPGARLTVERYDAPKGGFDSLFADQAVRINVERLP